MPAASHRKRDPTDTVLDMTSYSDLPMEIDWERLARAETHMLRISILEVLFLGGGRTLAPNEIAYELQTPLTHINYHAVHLWKAGFIRCVYERQVRGTMEHFYCPAEHSGADLFERLGLP